MRMFSRRLQILLDEERFRRVETEAHDHNLSVAAVIRKAIDVAYPADLDARRAAAEAILSAPQMDVPDPEELRAELDEIRAGAHR